MKTKEIVEKINMAIELISNSVEGLKEKENLSSFIENLRNKLENKTFTEKAPSSVVEQEKNKLAESVEKLNKIEEKLRSLI